MVEIIIPNLERYVREDHFVRVRISFSDCSDKIRDPFKLRMNRVKHGPPNEGGGYPILWAGDDFLVDGASIKDCLAYADRAVAQELYKLDRGCRVSSDPVLNVTSNIGVSLDTLDTLDQLVKEAKELEIRKDGESEDRINLRFGKSFRRSVGGKDMITFPISVTSKSIVEGLTCLDNVYIAPRLVRAYNFVKELRSDAESIVSFYS